jgi:hypothetical protein
MDADPVLIDASWFSAQHRARLFWGNVPGLGKTVIPEVDIKLQDCLLPRMNRRAVVEKIRTVTTNANSLRQGKSDYTCNSILFPTFNFFIFTPKNHKRSSS